MLLIKRKSLSILELLLAMGVFVVFIAGGLGFVVTGQKSSLMQRDYFKASQLASQGLEVVSYLKKSDWESLSLGNHGINYNGTNWVIIPNQDVTESKYTRIISISEVYRDDADNILELGAPGGDLDINTKRIVVSVSWDNSGQVKTVDSTSYITDWEQDVPIHYGGLMVYADYSGDDDVLKYKKFTVNGYWSIERTVPDIGVPDNRDTRRVEVYASPTRDEYVVMSKYSESGQYIYAQIYNGKRWGNSIRLSGPGSDSTPSARNFDGTYLNDGNFLAVYDDFTTTPKYRIWNGSSWSSESSIGDLGSLGYPVWMQVKAKPDSNNALFVSRDSLQKTISFYFDGSSWGSKTTHGTYSSGFSIENVSIAWNKFSENRLGLMFNEASDNNPNIKIWDDSNSSWGVEDEKENVGGRAEIFKITGDPTRDKFLGCVKNSNKSINCMTTDYTPNWLASFRIASNTNSNSARSYDLAYESQSGELALAVYSEGLTSEVQRYPKFRTYNPSDNSWSSENLMTSLGPGSSNALSTVRVFPAPTIDDMFVLMTDLDLNLFTILWDGESNSFSTRPGASLLKHALHGSNSDDFWYSFAWKIYDGE